MMRLRPVLRWVWLVGRDVVTVSGPRSGRSLDHGKSAEALIETQAVNLGAADGPPMSVTIS